jgi:hypothetical protein
VKRAVCEMWSAADTKGRSWYRVRGGSAGISITVRLIGAGIGVFVPPCVVAMVTTLWRENALVAMGGGTDGRCC